MLLTIVCFFFYLGDAPGKEDNRVFLQYILSYFEVTVTYKLEAKNGKFIIFLRTNLCPVGHLLRVYFFLSFLLD